MLNISGGVMERYKIITVKDLTLQQYLATWELDNVTFEAKDLLTKEQAIDAFLKFKKGKPFAPKEFGQKEQIEKLTGVYIPFWLYDVEASGEVLGTAIRTRRNRNYEKVENYYSNA